MRSICMCHSIIDSMRLDENRHHRRAEGRSPSIDFGAGGIVKDFYGRSSAKTRTDPTTD